MVRNMKIPRWSAAALALWVALVHHAGAQTRYNTQPVGNSVRLDGTSSAHDWEMEGTIIGGFLELGAGVALDKTQAAPAGMQGDKVPAKAHAIIPISSVHSKADHLPEVMDGLMQKTMKATDFPRIEYTLKELTFKGPHAAGEAFHFDADGELTIAGATNKVNFPVTIEPLDGGKIKITGTAAVKMTAYGVEPPAPNFGLGLMKCGDDVKIIFDWTLKEKK
jgi:polyisoprenoid-binding protein YceI